MKTLYKVKHFRNKFYRLAIAAIISITCERTLKFSDRFIPVHTESAKQKMQKNTDCFCS